MGGTSNCLPIEGNRVEELLIRAKSFYIFTVIETQSQHIEDGRISISGK